MPFPILSKYNESLPILHQKWSINWISLLVPGVMMLCNCPVAACLTAALLYLTHCDYENWLYSESCCDLLWRGQLKKNSPRGILLDANSTRTELKCSLSSLISISSISLYSSLCSTVINWLEVFFCFKVDGSKEVVYKHKVNCAPLKIIINSCKASVTPCDKWIQGVMEGQMWKVLFSNHSAQRFAASLPMSTKWWGHCIMKWPFPSSFEPDLPKAWVCACPSCLSGMNHQYWCNTQYRIGVQCSTATWFHQPPSAWGRDPELEPLDQSCRVCGSCETL